MVGVLDTVPKVFDCGFVILAKRSAKKDDILLEKLINTIAKKSSAF